MSRDFNGSTGELGFAVTATLRPTLPVTISVWINPDTLKTQGIFHNNKTGTAHKGIWLTMEDASGHIGINYGDNDGGSGTTSRRSRVSTGTVGTGAWTPVAARVRGATDLDIWIAGADAGGSNSGSGATLAYDTGLAGRVGSVATANYFDGRIAEIGFWSVSLSDAELVSLAKGISPRMVRPGSLIAHWPIWALQTNDIDLSANRVNVTTVNGTATLANHCPVGPPTGY